MNFHSFSAIFLAFIVFSVSINYIDAENKDIQKCNVAILGTSFCYKQQVLSSTTLKEACNGFIKDVNKGISDVACNQAIDKTEGVYCDIVKYVCNKSPIKP